VNPVLAGILYRSSGENSGGSNTNTTSTSLQRSQKAIARVAVGKGVRHGYVPHQTQNHHKNIDPSPQVLGAHSVSTNHVDPSPVQASLNALTQNFNQSMHEAKPSVVPSQQDVNQYQVPASSAVSTATTGRVSYVPGSLHRDDSLVDLAMIPIIDDGNQPESNAASSTGFSFVDFPFDSNIFTNEEPSI